MSTLKKDDFEGVSAEILRMVESTKTLPVGFIGSGFSRRYLNTPDWKGLLKKLAELTERPLEQFLECVDGKEDLPATASAIGSMFRTIWWEDKRFEKQRELYATAISDQYHPLKLQVAEFFQGLLNRTNFGLLIYQLTTSYGKN